MQNWGGSSWAAGQCIEGIIITTQLDSGIINNKPWNKDPVIKPTRIQWKVVTLRIIGPSYGGVWICTAGFRDLQTPSFEIPWFLGKGFFLWLNWIFFRWSGFGPNPSRRSFRAQGPKVDHPSMIYFLKMPPPQKEKKQYPFRSMYDIYIYFPTFSWCLWEVYINIPIYHGFYGIWTWKFAEHLAD